MMTKIGGLARALYILLAIVAGFVALGGMNVALILVVLGLIAGLAVPRERLVMAMVAAVAAPVIGAALSQIPAIGTQLNAVMMNLQLGVAGSAATALAIFLYEMVIAGVTGLTSNEAAGKTATA
ncbi:hypothetical protein LZ016_05110 [Sphingomonas sp. SM33]|jgi:hypothetical protein|uniref:Uncharacterized protein n=1 Tax=Sphingomonas telluris TaxID=2907998 RepID=A0ABS9VKJ7_9SPHN|nr:hypothetical protein [Sphingomonas telluris]MCH8615479.1 hypothetical protein [Sphingomonas telluris]